MGAFDVNIDNMWKVGKLLTMLLISRTITYFYLINICLGNMIGIG